MNPDIIKAIAVTAELTGTELSKHALTIMESDLQKYPPGKVLEALVRCRQELTSRLSLAAIIDRIDDGRPKADEAWGIALEAMDENATVVMNNEIASAFSTARDIYNEGDSVGARMAFRAAYERIVRDKKGEPVKWWPSLGHDPNKREKALLDAAQRGRISNHQAEKLLPAHLIENIKSKDIISNAFKGIS